MKWVYKFQDLMNRTPDDLKIVAFYATIFLLVGYGIGKWL